MLERERVLGGKEREGVGGMQHGPMGSHALHRVWVQQASNEAGKPGDHDALCYLSPGAGIDSFH